MDRRTALYLGRHERPFALVPDKPARRWPWLAVLALVLLGGGFVCGFVCGYAAGFSWAAGSPCLLAPGGTVTVEQGGGEGALYTCSATGEVVSRVPWLGGAR